MTADQELRLEVLTPEHVPLPFEVASAAHRILALLLDLLIQGLILLGLLAIVLGVLFVGGGESGGWMAALFGLAAFFLHNFYFAAAELRWQGRTPGKRKLGLRVVARDGGPLTAGMVLTRNLTRDLEVWLPMVALFAPEALFGDVPGWMRLVGALWLFVLAALPLFNRHRARLGDLIAGTVVVLEPVTVLLPDLVRDPPSSPELAGRVEPAFHFTRQQLDIYGIEELQVLEEILRRDNTSPELLDDICERIKRKIGWDRRRWEVPSEPFLRAFYGAQRARLEQTMLLGNRRHRKVR